MLKKLKSLFLVEEESNTPSSTTKKTTKSKSKPKTTKMAGKTPQVEVRGKPSEKFIDVLMQALEKNNLPEFDYLEFKQSLQSLKNMQMDEATQYKSAFAMATTMGANKSMLMDSISRYMNVLKSEESKFNLAVEKQKKQNIQSKEKNRQQLTKNIEAMKEQINKLNKDIETSEQQLNGIQGEIDNAQLKIETTKQSFYHSYKAVMDQIQYDMDAMKKYLAD